MRLFGAKTDEETNWFRESVRFYLGLGFFEEHRNLSDNDLVTTLELLLRESYLEGPTPSSRLADLEIMRLDDDRVWWEDIEADVGMGNDVYVQLLQDLSRISRGSFDAHDITESWESEEGPITVTFTAKGQRHVVHPEYKGDWMAPQVFEAAKRLFSGTPYGFYTFDTQGQDLFLV